MNINVINATTQTRLQPVIFGTKEQTEFTYKQLPGSYLNVGWVKVPPHLKVKLRCLKMKRLFIVSTLLLRRL